MTDRELFEMALDALETKGEHHPRVYQTIAALRGRVEQLKPKRPWVELTDEELEAMAEKYVTNCYFDTLKYARAIETKLKEKNSG